MGYICRDKHNGDPYVYTGFKLVLTNGIRPLLDILTFYLYSLYKAPARLVFCIHRPMYVVQPRDL